MIVIASTGPIALSTVEGCAQSPRSSFVIVLGFRARVGSRTRATDTNTIFARLASENFLSSL